MSEVSEIYCEAIDAVCSRAAGSGVLESCRLYLAQHQVPDDKLPLLYCRLGETLLHDGRREDAVDCARIAFELRADEEEIANICAWIFSNCGRWDEAGAAYE